MTCCLRLLKSFFSMQAVILAVYYYGLVSMMARDLTPSRPYGYQQVKEIDPEPINGNNSDQDEQTAPENSDIVKFIISFIPIMPLMQVCYFTQGKCLLDISLHFCTIHSSFSSSFLG